MLNKIDDKNSDKKKIVFIIPYFGRFNNYFPLWLNSCKMNPNVDWLIFTDDKTKYEYPKNVYVNYTSFRWIQNRIRKKFDFDVSIDRPYKLCDYRVAYGYLFQDFIKDYRMWGYCDVDLIWGNISYFITSDIIDEYDKIGILGHCTLYKNTEEINTVFMKKLNGVERYKQVFTEEYNNSFDEEFNRSINNIFYEYGYKVYDSLDIANIYTKSSDFKLTWQEGTDDYKVEKRKRAFFNWDNGNLYRYIKNNGLLEKREYLYIHMQSRAMMMKLPEHYRESYKIIPNVFEPLEISEINVSNFDSIRLKYFNLHYFKLRGKNLYLKIQKWRMKFK